MADGCSGIDAAIKGWQMIESRRLASVCDCAAGKRMSIRVVDRYD